MPLRPTQVGKPLVRLNFSHNQDHYHASALYAGLETLGASGEIQFLPVSTRAPGDPLVVEFSVSSDARERSVAIDLYDRSDVINRSILDRTDFYFKRSFYAPDLRALAAPLASKVRPYGLNFACRTVASSRRLLRTTGWHHALQGRNGFKRLYTFGSLPLQSDFEQSPAEALETAVVFQTRIWEESETGIGEHEEVNGLRVSVVRAMRSAFGPRFSGGLVATPLAVRTCPDEVVRQSTRRRDYTAMSKRHLIGVYTRGLHHSIAFKMAEYLAGAQCIVSEVPRNELPEPLIPGIHYLPFSSPGECVDACRRLLDDTKLADTMRRDNHAYYREFVDPASRLRRLIRLVLSE